MWLPLLVDGGGMVFDGSGEFQPSIEEAYNSGFLFCEELDEWWRTEESWGGLMTKSFNGRGTGSTSDDNSLLFKLLYLLLEHWLSLGLFCEKLLDCWQIEYIWCGLMNKIFNAWGTGITSDNDLLIFELISLQFKHWLPRGVFRFLP